MRPEITLGTIGFTRTTAERFFEKLAGAGIRTVVDTRARTSGQLAAFAKTPDLPYFLRALADIGYRCEAELAPSAELLARYRSRAIDWNAYAQAYRALLETRRPERSFSADELDRTCLLCSELSAEHCHRRIAAEYLRDAFASQARITIVHL